MRVWAGVFGAAAGLAMAGGGLAQEAPAFPASLQREPLLLWLQRETDIQADRVVAVTPQALTSVVSTFPAGGGQGPRVVIRAEALSAETYARTGALSWHVSLNADCQGRRVKLGETTGYPQRNLLGERKLLRPAETAWRTPEKGTALEYAWRSVCETGFKGPLQGSGGVKVAQADAPHPASAEPAKPAAAKSAPAPEAARPAPRTQAAAPKPPAPKPPASKAEPRLEVARAAPAAAKAAGGAGLVAQVGASPSEADAKGLLAGLEPRLGGRKAWVEKAAVGGKTWYRAVVGGFADTGEATSFCAGLKSAGRACFVRAGKAG